MVTPMITRMEFVWNDGGRASSGFVGAAGDCVTRSIAIATGQAYRDVYASIGKRTAKSPRGGVETSAAEQFLREMRWTEHTVEEAAFSESLLDDNVLPKGILIADLARKTGRGGHYCCLVDHVVHDTWNPMDDGVYQLVKFWMPPASTDTTLPQPAVARPSNAREQLTQKQFEKILRRLRALENTASDRASTDGEKRNAISMMKNLMLSHNLSSEDLGQDESTGEMCFTRRACPLNGRRAAGWEKDLAWYLTREIFPNVQWYMATRGHRTFFWFYGPAMEVENTIELFRELVVTIAAAAKIQYGSWARGSGASYAEGYVAGLPRESAPESDAPDDANQAGHTTRLRLIRNRALSIHAAARSWLAHECQTRLSSGSAGGRYAHDASAANRGKQHGARHNISPANRQLRLPGK